MISFDCTGDYNPSGSQAKPVFSMEVPLLCCKCEMLV
jgi:hypothetical protein